MRINLRLHSRNRNSRPINTGIGTRNIHEIFKSVDSFIGLVSEMAEKGQEKVENTGKNKNVTILDLIGKYK